MGRPKITCSHCEGTGRVGRRDGYTGPFGGTEKCPTCKGTGKAEVDGMSLAEIRKFYTAVGAQVRLQRERFGLSQEQLAEKVEISWEFLRRLEAGRATLMLHTWVALSKVLGGLYLDDGRTE